jgi:hypothetical protein
MSLSSYKLHQLKSQKFLGELELRSVIIFLRKFIDCKLRC